MAKVKFDYSVKYKRERKVAHTPFEVDKKDLDDLIEAGAIVLEDKKEEKKKETKKEEKKK